MGLKTATDLVKGIRYKLQMMGIPIEGPAHMCVDNMSVVHNSSRPESTLKKKSNSIAYHYVRENVAAKVLEIAHLATDLNLADMLTKTQAGPVWKKLQILYCIKIKKDKHLKFENFTQFYIKRGYVPPCN
jgi:hypothetical protein